VAAAAALLLLLFFFRFQRKNATIPAIMARTATPPTTPPAIGPAFEVCEDSLAPLLFAEELVSAFAVEVPEAAAATLMDVASLPSES
jgi:hypothetical protein